MLIENFPFFLRTQQLGSQKEREQSLQNSENSMFLGSNKKSYQSLQNSVVRIFWVRKKKGTNRCKKVLASFGLMPVDPEAGAMSSKLTCQCITPLCNAMILKILRCVDWWLTHSCLLDVELLANKMPTKVCVSAQLWMRPHVVHHASCEKETRYLVCLKGNCILEPLVYFVSIPLLVLQILMRYFA